LRFGIIDRYRADVGECGSAWTPNAVSKPASVGNSDRADKIMMSPERAESAVMTV
jgi:hypothetical protein